MLNILKFFMLRLEESTAFFHVMFLMGNISYFSVKDNDNAYYAQAQDGVKFLMNSFIPTIQAMININSNKHRKVF